MRLWMAAFSLVLLIATTADLSITSAATGPLPASGYSSFTAGLAPAPDFEVTLYEGREVRDRSTFRLTDLQGQPLVLNFWAPFCPPCRAEMPEF